VPSWCASAWLVVSSSVATTWSFSRRRLPVSAARSRSTVTGSSAGVVGSPSTPGCWHGMLRYRKYIRGVIDSQNGNSVLHPVGGEAQDSGAHVVAPRPSGPVPALLPPLVSKIGQWLERVGASLVYRDRSIIAISPSTRRHSTPSLGSRATSWSFPPGAIRWSPRCRASVVGRPLPASSASLGWSLTNRWPRSSEPLPRCCRSSLTSSSTWWVTAPSAPLW